MIARRCSSCSRSLGAWELYAALGDVDDFVLPAPDARSPTALWRRPRRCCGTTSGVTAHEVGLGILARARRRRRARARAPPLARAAPRALPAARRLAGRPDRDPRAAAGRLVRLRHRPEARRSSRSSASSRSSSRRSTRSPRSTPSSASSCARSTPRAGRRSAGSSSRRAARRAQRREDRRRRRRHRRRLRRVRRLQRGPRPPHPPGHRRSSRPRAPTPPSSSSPRFALAALRAARSPSAARALGPPRPRRSPTMTRRAVARRRCSPLAAALALAACGEQQGADAAAPAAARASTLVLDYLPNADHAGSTRRGERRVRARPGSTSRSRRRPTRRAAEARSRPARPTSRSPTSPRCCSRATRAPRCVAIGALVQKPLTSLMSSRGKPVVRPSDLDGKTVGTAGIPYQDAYLETILDERRRRPRACQEGQRRLQPRPGDAVRRVDATLGAFWNYEGVAAASARKRSPRSSASTRLGVPTYDELVLVARARDGRATRRRAAALHAGARARHARRARATRGGVDALRRRPTPDLDRGLQRGERQGDAAGLLPRGREQAVRLAGPGAVAGLRQLDASTTACSRSRRPPARVLTNEFLPGEGVGDSGETP